MRPGTRVWGVGVLAFALVLTLAFAPAASAKLIVGNKRDNKLVGAGKRDDIFGRAGRDVLIGFNGRDRLYGEEENDVLVGGEGNDLLWGHGLDDTLDGGPGSDILRPGYGRDVVYAGRGNDVIWAAESDGDLDVIECGPGFDRVVFSRRTSLRRDRAFDCESWHAVRGRGVPGRIQVGVDDFPDILTATGLFRDVLVGLGGDDYLNGGELSDTILGNEGDDELNGEFSPDNLLGGSGDDTIWGHYGHDRLWGGLGLDKLHGDWLTADPSDGRDEIISIEDDGVRDQIYCGRRRDRVVARPNDLVYNCERVIRISR